jgi:hypothetical protein
MEPEPNNKKSVSKGFMGALIGGIILLAVALYPNLNPPHPPSYDSHTKAALKTFHMGCSIYWEEKENEKICDKEIAFQKAAGPERFPPDWWGKISIEGGGTSKTFHATASHEKSKRTFKIDNEGEILEVLGD